MMVNHSGPSPLGTGGCLRQWAQSARRDVLALWIAARDPRTPWYAKVAAASVGAYALSPIDLIPDFVPVLGYMDDLLIVPLGILFAVWLVPADLMAEFRAQAEGKRPRPSSYLGAAIVAAIWLAAAAFLLWAFWATEAAGLN